LRLSVPLLHKAHFRAGYTLLVLYRTMEKVKKRVSDDPLRVLEADTSWVSTRSGSSPVSIHQGEHIFYAHLFFPLIVSHAVFSLEAIVIVLRQAGIFLFGVKTVPAQQIYYWSVYPECCLTQISPKLAASYSDGLKAQSCEQDRE
jgi:hypothetical protein